MHMILISKNNSEQEILQIVEHNKEIKTPVWNSEKLKE